LTAVDVENASKTFGTIKAVDGVSFNVERGEVFGLLGPNGAGKTTIIRLVLDIFKPDSGRILVLGGPIDEAKKERIGYMPEERGLYQDIPLERCLVYLATLKGISAEDAKRRAGEYLERFDLAEFKRSKVKELSKGMQQKAQIIATLLHDPELVIIDEPFTALDPVNTRMIKSLLRELSAQGVTLIMSTHQMHQVEELCDRILLINHGRTMLYGPIGEIRRKFSGNAIVIRSTEKPLAQLAGLAGVIKVESTNSTHRLTLSPEVSAEQMLHTLVEREVPIDYFEVAVPTLDEIFIQVVQGEGALNTQ
jgi:ABC-2 type transport system ATP-binding protein